MHTDFITSDIFEIVDDAIMSASTIDPNIAHYPLCEYLFTECIFTTYRISRTKIEMYSLGDCK